jgi:hypothetical protein
MHFGSIGPGYPHESRQPILSHQRANPVGDSNSGSPALASRRYESKDVRTAVVDSNSTRTESCVAIRPDPKALVQVGAPNATDHNG